MQLIADSARFSSNKQFSGFMMLVLFSSPLFIISTYLILTPPKLFADAMPAVFAFAIGSIIVLFLFGLFLKARGLIFKIPFRVYDKGILIQSITHIKPNIIEWPDIQSLTFWVGVPYKKNAAGAAALTPKGEIESVELFKDKEALKDFVAIMKPFMEKNSMKVYHEDEGESSYLIVFRKTLPF